MEQCVLLEVRERVQPVRRRPLPEHREDRRREHLLEIEVVARARPMRVHLPVHEQPRREEHLQRPDPGLVQRQPPFRDERVPAQPLASTGPVDTPVRYASRRT